MLSEKVAIITDSIACLPPEITERYGIRILPVHFYHGGQHYTDGVNITPSEAYRLFQKDPDSFKTSGVSPGECLDVYRQAVQQTASIIVITISSRLSAIYQVARATSEQIKAERPGLSIEIIDSGTVAAAEGFIVLAAARAASEGKSLAEVVRFAEEVRDKVNLVAILETVRYVYRTGRIPKIAARVGSILNIRPIFTIASGVPRFIGAARNKERGIDRLLKIAREKVDNKKVHMAVIHAYASDEAEKLKQRVLGEFSCIEIMICEFSPIMGYAAGTGTLGLAFYVE